MVGCARQDGAHPPTMAAEQVLAFRNGPPFEKQSPPTKAVMPRMRLPPAAEERLVRGVGCLASAMPLQRGVIQDADLSLFRFGRHLFRPCRRTTCRGFDLLDLHGAGSRLRLGR